jgi:hypothetical protein
MATINITYRGNVEGIEIDDDFFAEMWPDEYNGTLQPFPKGAANLADGLHNVLALAWYLKSGKSFPSAQEEAFLRSRRIH